MQKHTCCAAFLLLLTSSAICSEPVSKPILESLALKVDDAAANMDFSVKSLCVFCKKFQLPALCPFPPDSPYILPLSCQLCSRYVDKCGLNKQPMKRSGLDNLGNQW